MGKWAKELFAAWDCSKFGWGIDSWDSMLYDGRCQWFDDDSFFGGALRSWVVSDFVAGVSRLARRSTSASLTTEYGKGLRRMSRRCEYHCSSWMSEMSMRCP